jgi:hypothetical protein
VIYFTTSTYINALSRLLLVATDSWINLCKSLEIIRSTSGHLNLFISQSLHILSYLSLNLCTYPVIYLNFLTSLNIISQPLHISIYLSLNIYTSPAIRPSTSTHLKQFIFLPLYISSYSCHNLCISLAIYYSTSPHL